MSSDGSLNVVSRLAEVMASPLDDMADRLSSALQPLVSHAALMLLAVDDVGHPQQVGGDVSIARHVTFAEMDRLRSVAPAGSTVRVVAQLAGRPRNALVCLSRTGALLVLADPGAEGYDELVAAQWDVVAMRIHLHASEASPTYLMESRAAASVRAEAVTELADRHSATLEALLAVLRSVTLDDRGARQTATQLAAEAAVDLRTATDRVLTFTEEPVKTAFERLRDDLRPLVRYRDLDVQFVEPPVDGRALPSEVAHGARAVVRGAILALADQSDLSRVRVQWDCDGRNLLVNVRDDGPGDLTIDSAELQSLRQRVVALSGVITIEAVRGWGSEMSVIMPLDPPNAHRADLRLGALSAREREVVDLAAAGLRNKGIAERLGISENTVKFHLAGVFRKLDVVSRSELVALVLRPSS